MIWAAACFQSSMYEVDIVLRVSLISSNSPRRLASDPPSLYRTPLMPAVPISLSQIKSKHKCIALQDLSTAPSILNEIFKDTTSSASFRVCCAEFMSQSPKSTAPLAHVDKTTGPLTSNVSQFSGASLMDMLQTSISAPSFVPVRPNPSGVFEVEGSQQAPNIVIHGASIEDRTETAEQDILRNDRITEDLQMCKNSAANLDASNDGCPPIQADSLTHGQAGLHEMEAEKIQQEKRNAELQYQAMYYKERKNLLNKVDEFQKAIMTRSTELLPPEYWSVLPQVLLVTVSSYGKVFTHMSEGLKQDAKADILLQELNTCLQKIQLNAIHAARLQAGSGKVYVPKPQQFGRLRKKSEFSRMQALFGHHFKTVLLPKALSALEAKINEAYRNGFAGKRGEAAQKAESNGFQQHKSSECRDGCESCCAFRESIDWPKGVPLLKNPAAHQKKTLQMLCEHYGLKLADGPEEETHPAEGDIEGRTELVQSNSQDNNNLAHQASTADPDALRGLVATENSVGELLPEQNQGSFNIVPQLEIMPTGKQKARKKEQAKMDHSEALNALLQVTAAHASSNQQGSLDAQLEPSTDILNRSMSDKLGQTPGELPDSRSQAEPISTASGENEAQNATEPFRAGPSKVIELTNTHPNQPGKRKAENYEMILSEGTHVPNPPDHDAVYNAKKVRTDSQGFH